MEAAEDELMSAAEARGYAEAFNHAAWAAGRRLCAVVVPVKVRYAGEPRPGDVLKAPVPDRPAPVKRAARRQRSVRRTRRRDGT